ncbi:extracellular solute-binding protein [Caballeronia sordidicola]|uniref:Extracellular solute-binding protein n=1 Tax=Caballeronia sordidicola TaxID=196367 RepID=A0A158FQV9_CABSO|nr:ABC transporter substrate-binding protein [Caballeronia sordidicola]SAL21983.1 extracellular solute-binding protein [Caballeronia sordidicola]
MGLEKSQASRDYTIQRKGNAMIVRFNEIFASVCFAVLSSIAVTAHAEAAGTAYEIKLPTTFAKTVVPPAKVAKAGKIVMCTELGDPPAGFLAEDGSTPKGFNVDIMSAIGPVMGVKTEVINYPFADIFAALDSGKCDAVMSSSSKSPARVARYNFVTYMTMRLGLMVPKGNPLNLKTFDDLAGHRGAVLVSSTTERLLKAASAKAVSEGKSPIEIQSYPQNTTVFHQLQLGRVDAFVGDAMTIGYWEHLSNGRFQVGGLPVEPLTIGIVMRKDDPQIEDAVRKAYISLFDSGYVQQSSKKWGMDGFITLCRDEKPCS